MKKLLEMIHEGNRRTGGLRTVIANAVAIVGIVKFLQKHTLIFATKRREVGVIGRHRVYTIDKVQHYKISSTDVAVLSLQLCLPSPIVETAGKGSCGSTVFANSAYRIEDR